LQHCVHVGEIEGVHLHVPANAHASARSATSGA
jgi:hypothetical protein